MHRFLAGLFLQLGKKHVRGLDRSTNRIYIKRESRNLLEQEPGLARRVTASP